MKKKSLVTKLKKIKVIAMDIDGVLTGGEIIILKSGDLKIWSVKDRLAFTILKNLNPLFKLVWVTGRASEDVRTRANEVGVELLFENCANKREALKEIINKLNVSADEIAYIGDDLIDIPVLKRVGVSVCPKDADNEVKKYCMIILKTPGGKGAFREFLEMLLKAKNLWKKAISHYTDA